MLAADVRPTRLQRAKLAIMDFVQRRGRGRVGLVAFAGQAFLQCPLTFDYGAFQEALTIVDDKTIPVPGTDIGRALDEGVHALQKSERQKLLVVLTDGEDLEKRGPVQKFYDSFLVPDVLAAFTSFKPASVTGVPMRLSRWRRVSSLSCFSPASVT